MVFAPESPKSCNTCATRNQCTLENRKYFMKKYKGICPYRNGIEEFYR